MRGSPAPSTDGNRTRSGHRQVVGGQAEVARRAQGRDRGAYRGSDPGRQLDAVHPGLGGRAAGHHDDGVRARRDDGADGGERQVEVGERAVRRRARPARRTRRASAPRPPARRRGRRSGRCRTPTPARRCRPRCGPRARCRCRAASGRGSTSRCGRTGTTASRRAATAARVTDSPGPPATTVSSPVARSRTTSCAASHGIAGWFHCSQASVPPSGDSRGAATKSGPVTSTSGSPGRARVEDDDLVADVGGRSPRWRSRTQTIRVPSGAELAVGVAVAARPGRLGGERDGRARRARAGTGAGRPSRRTRPRRRAPTTRRRRTRGRRCARSALGQQVVGATVGAAADELRAAALGRPALGPDDVRAVHPHLAEAHGRGHDDLGGQRRGPRAEGALTAGRAPDPRRSARATLAAIGASGRVTCAGRSAENPHRPGQRPRPDAARSSAGAARRPGRQRTAPSARRVPTAGVRHARVVGGQARVGGVQLGVAARAHAHRDPQQVRQVAGDPRARPAGRVVHDEDLAALRHDQTARSRRPAHRRRCTPAAGARPARRRPTPPSSRRRRSTRSTAPASPTGPPRSRPRRRARRAAAPRARRRPARDAAAPTASRCASRCPSRTRTAARPTARGAARPRARAGRSPARGTATAPAPGPARRARPRRAARPGPAPGPAPGAARRAPRRRTPRGARPAGGPRRTSAGRVCRARPTRSAGTPSCGFRWSRSWRTRPRSPPRRPAAARSRRAPAATAAAHPASSASARVTGCRAQRAAVTGPGRGRARASRRRLPLSSVLGVLGRPPRCPPRPRRPAPRGSGWPAPAR